MSEIEYKISCKVGGKRTKPSVTGATFPSTPGLAIRKYHDSWCVDHIASGWSFGWFNLRRQALWFARYLAKLLDCTQKYRALCAEVKRRDLGKQIRAAKKDFAADRRPSRIKGNQ